MYKCFIKTIKQQKWKDVAFAADTPGRFLNQINDPKPVGWFIYRGVAYFMGFQYVGEEPLNDTRCVTRGKVGVKQPASRPAIPYTPSPMFLSQHLETSSLRDVRSLWGIPKPTSKPAPPLPHGGHSDEELENDDD